MRSYTANEVRNVVLLGHSGCGKTTLAEAALFNSGAITRMGSVTDGNTVSDYDAEEIRRGVSVSASVLPVEWMDTKINLLDTPGYFDFASEARLALSVADTAIIVVSAKSGIEVGTEKAWEYAEEMGIPKMLFINQMDDPDADFAKTLDELREKYGKTVAPLQVPFRDENGVLGFINVIKRDARMLGPDGKLVKCDIPEDKADEVEEARAMAVEVAAETDDELLEKFFNDEELSLEEIYAGLKKGIRSNSITPVIFGSATKSYGVKLLLSTLVKFIPPSAECRPSFQCIDLRQDSPTKMIRYNTEKDHLACFVFKTISDPYMGRLNLFRVVSGVIDNTKTVYNPEKDTYEKISHLYVMRGKELIEVDELNAGDIGALAKLTNTSTQDTLCSKYFPVILPKITLQKPVLSMAIVPKGKGDEDKISNAMAKIREEDPTLKMEVNKETKQTIVSGVGEQQMEALVNKLKVKYKIEVDLVDPIIPYRETIKAKVKVQGRYKKQSGGHGQFGDVWIEFEPSGDLSVPYVFEEKIFGGSVPKQYFPAVDKGLSECVQAGVLAGYPVVGLKATLVDGSYHPVDSSEMAFKMATSVAFKEGLPQAKPTILEPVMSTEITVPDKYMGDIMGDINKRRGRILSMNPDKDKKVISAEIPLSEMQKYATDLRSMTQGRASFEYYFERYEEAPADVQKRVIAAAAKQ